MLLVTFDKLFNIGLILFDALFSIAFSFIDIAAAFLEPVIADVTLFNSSIRTPETPCEGNSDVGGVNVLSSPEIS